VTGGAPRVALLAAFSGAGGVERMLLNLAAGIATAGYGVDLLTIRRDSPHLHALPAGVRHVPLPGGHAWAVLPALTRYLRREPPAGLIAAKDRANRVAVLARALAGRPLPLALRLGTHLGGARGPDRTAGDRLRGFFYRRADAVIAVSQAMADDLVPRFGLAAARVRVIRNPVVTPGLAELATAPCPHPWLEEGEPVIVGMGRFTRQKDFPTLLRAFARLCRQRPARLVLLGEGAGKAECAELATELGIADRVLLPGARADVAPFPSLFEGFPNALAEALAAGIPAIGLGATLGVNGLIEDGTNGLLVDATPEAFAAGLARLMEDDALRARMGAAAREITTRYAPAGTYARWEALLAEMAAGRGRR